MAENKYADCIVEGKPIKEWLKSDEGLVDYEKCEFLKNVSNSDEIVIYDLGEYVFDPDVRKSRWCNGVDLARVAACVKYDESYEEQNIVTAMNGDDYVRIFFNNFIGASIQEFILYFYYLLNGDIYISETNGHVFVKGCKGSDEEWEAAVEVLKSKARIRK